MYLNEEDVMILMSANNSGCEYFVVSLLIEKEIPFSISL